MYGLGMDRHSVIEAPRIRTADRRQAHLLARIVGTLAAAAFMISLSAGTAQALDIGEIVEELPVEIDLGIGSTPPPEPEGELEQSVAGLGKVVDGVVEDVTEVVTEPVSSQPAPTQQPATQNPVNAIVEPVTRVIEPVAEVVEELARSRPGLASWIPPPDDPVAVIEEPVGQVTRPVIEALGPVTGTVAKVVDSAADTVEKPVTGIIHTVSPALEEVVEPLRPVLGVVTTTVGRTTGLVGEVSTPILDGVDDLVDVAVPLIPPPDDLLGGGDGFVEGPTDSDPAPTVPTAPSRNPDPVTSRPDQGPPRSITSPAPPVMDVVPSPIPAPSAIGDNASSSPMAATFSPSAPHVGSGTNLAPNYLQPTPDESGASGVPSRAGVVATASSSSSSGSSTGLLAVLVLLGLIAPRLSRWLRPRPVLWRQFALAETLELPG